jgi:hypothetical protein
MGYAVAQIDSLLVEQLERNPEELFPLSAEFITMFEDKTESKPTNHRNRRVPYIDSFPASFGFTSPAGSADLVATASMTDSNINITPAHLESGIEIDYDSWVNNEKGDAIIDVVSRNVALQLKFFNQMRDIYASSGTAGTSVLATASATSANAATSITCNGASDFFGTTRIFKGMSLDAWDSTLVTQRNTSPIVVTAVSGTTITVNAMALSSSIVNTDVLVPTGQTSGLAGEPYHNAASGAYFDKADRTLTYGLVASSIAASAAISAALMIKLKMYVARRAQSLNLQGYAWFTSTSIWPSYRSLAYTNSRVIFGTNPLPGTDLGQVGRSKKTMQDLSFDGDPIYVFKFWTPDRMSFLNISDFEHHVLKPLGPMLSPAGDWLQMFTGSTNKHRHAVGKFVDSFEQTYCKAPMNQGALTGITISGSETASPKTIGV